MREGKCVLFSQGRPVGFEQWQQAASRWQCGLGVGAGWLGPGTDAVPFFGTESHFQGTPRSRTLLVDATRVRVGRVAEEGNQPLPEKGLMNKAEVLRRAQERISARGRKQLISV